MSLTLFDLVNFLNSKTTNINDYINSLNQFKKLDDKMYNEYKFQTTDFSYGDTLNNLLFCLMYCNIIPGFDNSLIADELDQYDRNIIKLNDKIITDCRNNIINKINDENFTFSCSKKKILTLINNNQYNHEIILIICVLYNVNIFIFYKDINLIKVYYPEDQLIVNKKNIFLQFNKDIYSSLNTFQNMYIENNGHKQQICKWSNIKHIVLDNKKHIYPIGIAENKELIIDENNLCNDKFTNLNKQQLKTFIFDGAKITDVKTYKKILNTNQINIDFRQ